MQRPMSVVAVRLEPIMRGRLAPPPRVRARRGVTFGTFRMKQINVFPMLMMLVVVVLLIAYLGGYLT